MKYVVIYLLFVNLLALFLYGLDKYKAAHHLWRIRESVLFGVALLGGGVGALAGMFLFRHKTRHLSFLIGIPLILAAEAALACFFLAHYISSLPYPKDPVKVVEHELAALTDTSSDAVESFLGEEEAFLTDEADDDARDSLQEAMLSFFDSFSYEILSSSHTWNTAKVRVSLTTLDGQAVAKAYSLAVLRQQMTNSVDSSDSTLSVSDCCLLLNQVLGEESFSTITTEETIALTRNPDDASWSIDDTDALNTAVTGDFARYVADPDLIGPGEVLDVYLSTLTTFDTDQLIACLSPDSLIGADDTVSQAFARAIAEQVHACLDYRILSESVDEDAGKATVSIELTNLDCQSIMEQYQAQVQAYTSTSQALADGSGVRVQRSFEMLIAALEENTAKTTISLDVNLSRDTSGWYIEMTDEFSQALLGNFTAAYAQTDAAAEDTAGDGADS